MKKFVSLKTKALVAMSLAVIVIIVGTVTIGYVLSSLSYSQKLKSPFNMSYKAPDPWASVVYPQTYVGDTLNAALENLVSASSSELVATDKQWTVKTSMNGEKTCLEYTYKGQKYARLVGAMPISSNIKFLNSSGGGTIKEDANYWFKVEPIEFDTFTGITGIDGTIKVTKMILSSCMFDGGSQDWAESNLKSYLNSTFLNETGLSSFAKDRTYYSTSYIDEISLVEYGSQITNKLWAPSVDEIQEMYKTNATRHKVATDFARATYTEAYDSTVEDCLLSINGTNESCASYWLRSASYNQDICVWGINDKGILGNSYGYDAPSGGFIVAFVVNE